MSKDIRSFFKVIPKGSASESQKTVGFSGKKKTTKRLIDSDEEDVVASTPEVKKSKPVKKQKVQVLSSNSESETKTKASLKKLKPVSVSDLFNTTPVKQSKVEIVPNTPAAGNGDTASSKRSKSRKKKGKNVEQTVHNDTDFEKTLQELDDDDFNEEVLELLDKSEIVELDASNIENNLNDRKRSRTDSSNENKTPKKKKIEQTDSGIDPGQEAHEKKRYSAMLYQKYLNRSGPKQHGVKDYPKGKPDCLKNLCFLKTGVLDSLESEEFEKLIKDHGGRVVHAVSRKVNYVVAGEDAGPAKLAKAETYNIPTISENELLDMILKKSGMEPRFCTNTSDGSSDDLGIVPDEETNKKRTEIETESYIKNVNDTAKPPAELQSKGLNGKAKSPTKVKSSPVKATKAETIPIQSSQTKVKQVVKTKVEASLPLTEKYKPQNLCSIIGQQGADGNLNKLKRWLENWYRNQDPKVRKTLPKPTPWTKNGNGAYFKCALLSGPPGVGKTTSATLVARELGLDVVEFNASDTRSKKLLHVEVAQLLSSHTIAGYATGQGSVNKKRVLLMDEVDGMAGNEDRGGIQELIQLIKSSSIPIICMCNDRNHQKMRSLVNYCFDLKFTKPHIELIRGPMMSICSKENINISPKALTEIIAGTGCDIRQTLNHLSILASTDQEITPEVAEKKAKAAKKDTVMGTWEVCRAVFTKSDHKDMSLGDRARLFFFDYSLGPLFVQENYLKVQPEGCNIRQSLLKATYAADAISMGDLIDVKIRRSNNWSLLESQAFFSSVMPGHHMAGHFNGRMNFPGWLGKNSKKNRFSRLVTDLRVHTCTSASTSKTALKLDYLVPLRNAIIAPLASKGLNGINESVQVMKTYNLLREDLDSLLELCQWMRGENLINKVDAKVKAAFTRAYNKQVTLLPYAPASGVSKKRAVALESEAFEEDVSDNDDDDDISNYAMIKVKKPAKSTSKKNEPKKSRAKKTK